MSEQERLMRRIDRRVARLNAMTAADEAALVEIKRVAARMKELYAEHGPGLLDTEERILYGHFQRVKAFVNDPKRIAARKRIDRELDHLIEQAGVNSFRLS